MPASSIQLKKLWWAGPLHRARQIEGMQLLHIILQGTLGTNWGNALKIVV